MTISSYQLSSLLNKCSSSAVCRHTTLSVTVCLLCPGLLWFSEDIGHMLGARPNFYWLFCWAVAAPLLVLVRKTCLVCSFARSAVIVMKGLSWPEHTVDSSFLKVISAVMVFELQPENYKFCKG